MTELSKDGIVLTEEQRLSLVRILENFKKGPPDDLPRGGRSDLRIAIERLMRAGS